VPVRASDFALAIALYTLVAYTGRKSALIYSGWLLAGTLLWAIFQVGDLQAVFLVFMVFVIFGFSWAMGEFVGARRAYQSELEQRLKLLETERDQQAKIAVGEERSRIARELHDVVAHAVSVMIVHADGAAYTISSAPAIATSITLLASSRLSSAAPRRKRVFSCCSLIATTTSGSRAQMVVWCPARASRSASAVPHAPPPTTEQRIRASSPSCGQNDSLRRAGAAQCSRGASRSRTRRRGCRRCRAAIAVRA